MDIKAILEENIKGLKDFPVDERDPWPTESSELYELLRTSENFRGRALMGYMLFMLETALSGPGPNAMKAERDARTKKAEDFAVRLSAAMFLAGYKAGKAEAEINKLESLT